MEYEFRGTGVCHCLLTSSALAGVWHARRERIRWPSCATACSQAVLFSEAGTALLLAKQWRTTCFSGLPAPRRISQLPSWLRFPPASAASGGGILGDMLFSPRIKMRHLAGLCRRSATALGAGIDVRTVWAREAERTSGWATRGRLLTVSEAVHRGESMAEALAATGDFFPPLFRELVAVGEQSGQLSEVFAQLADHYEGRLQLRRVFLGAIAWPMIELAAAVVVIGFLIWIMGVIGHGIDPLGFGLVGNAGLMIYIAFLATVGVLFFLILEAVRRGLVWTRPIQRARAATAGPGKGLADPGAGPHGLGTAPDAEHRHGRPPGTAAEPAEHS